MPQHAASPRQVGYSLPGTFSRPPARVLAIRPPRVPTEAHHTRHWQLLLTLTRP